MTFDRTDACVRNTEVTLFTDTNTELAEPLRWIIAGLTALSVGVPVGAGLVVAFTSVSEGNSRVSEIWLPAAAAGVLVVAAAGGGGYAAGGAAGPPTATTERFVLEHSVPMNQKVVPTGSFSTGAGPAHPVVNGVVELTFEEALALLDGQMRLDGASVELIGIDTGVRLRSLRACHQAVSGAAMPPLALAGDQARLAAAEECGQADWSFAESVRDSLKPQTNVWLLPPPTMQSRASSTR